jgi:hypothetical protein
MNVDILLFKYESRDKNSFIWGRDKTVTQRLTRFLLFLCESIPKLSTPFPLLLILSVCILLRMWDQVMGGFIRLRNVAIVG